MVSNTLFPAVHISGSQNVYSRAEVITDYYWPRPVFCLMVFPGFHLFKNRFSRFFTKLSRTDQDASKNGTQSNPKIYHLYFFYPFLF